MQSIRRRLLGCVLIGMLASSAMSADREAGPKVLPGDRDRSSVARIIKSFLAHILDLGQISVPPGLVPAG